MFCIFVFYFQNFVEKEEMLQFQFHALHISHRVLTSYRFVKTGEMNLCYMYMIWYCSLDNIWMLKKMIYFSFTLLFTLYCSLVTNFERKSLAVMWNCRWECMLYHRRHRLVFCALVNVLFSDTPVVCVG